MDNPAPEKKPPVIETPPFDIDVAMKNAKFVQYLNEIPGIENSLDDVDAIKQRFETFQKKDTVSRGLQEFFKQQFELETENKLSPTELASVAKFIEDQVKNNPELISEFEGQLTRIKNGPAEIAALEKQVADVANVDLKNLQDEHGELLKRQADLKEKASDAIETRGDTWRGILEKQEKFPFLAKFAGKSLDKRQKSFENELKDIDEDIQANLEAQKEAGATKVALAEAKERYASMRQEILRNTPLAGEITRIAQAKAQEKLKSLIDPKAGLEKIEQGRKYLEKLIASRDSESGSGADYLNGETEETVRQRIDTAVEGVITGKIVETVKKLNFSDGASEKLAKSLEKFAEKVGAKDQGESRAFVVNILEGILAGKDGVEAEKGPKRLLIKRLIINLTK
ncbi:MAG: hypothetical protein V4467_02175 [Patescibacteria group bacterium]